MRILMIHIPDQWHRSYINSGILMGYLVGKSLVEIAHIGSSSKEEENRYTLHSFPWENLSNYDVIVTLGQTGDTSLMGNREEALRPKSTDNMSESQAEAIVEFVKRGGGCVAIHAASREFNSEFTKMIGGSFKWHPPQCEFKVEVADPSHPITQRIEAFSITDELYFTEHDKSSIHVLLDTYYQGGRRQGGEEIVDDGKRIPMMWIKKCGRGRATYVAPGHSLKTFLNPTYLNLLERAVRWVAHKL